MCALGDEQRATGPPGPTETERRRKLPYRWAGLGRVSNRIRPLRYTERVDPEHSGWCPTLRKPTSQEGPGVTPKIHRFSSGWGSQPRTARRKNRNWIYWIQGVCLNESLASFVFWFGRMMARVFTWKPTLAPTLSPSRPSAETLDCFTRALRARRYVY